MPNLIIIAGCNGAGKSTFASSFLPEGLKSFDYDKLFLTYYRELPDSELREKFAKDKTTAAFEQEVEQAINEREDFCYETNFDVLPLYWAEKFRENGFIINLIFFCLENQEIAHHRIQVRTEFRGHFVNNQTIDFKWKEGYKNLNIHYSFFDNILIVDNSRPGDIYTNVLQIKKGVFTLLSEQLPSYIKHRLPNIYRQISE